MSSSAITKSTLTHEETMNGLPGKGSHRLEWVFLLSLMLLSDMFSVGLAFRFAYWIRFELPISVFDPQGLISVAHYRSLAWILIPHLVLFFALAGLYKPSNLLGGTKEYSRLFTTNSLAMVSLVAAGFFEPDLIVARGIGYWIGQHRLRHCPGAVSCPPGSLFVAYPWVIRLSRHHPGGQRGRHHHGRAVARHAQLGHPPAGFRR